MLGGGDNPLVTDADGAFAWEVVEADYEITAEAQSCEPAGARVEEFDADGNAEVVLVLDCDEPTDEPTSEPTDEPTGDGTDGGADDGADDGAAGDDDSAGPGGQLPETGAEVAALAALAALLVATGAFVLVRRRALL